MKIEQLFPVCQDKACPQRGQHAHPLPHQLELINDPAKYIYVQGGYGSAKTLGGCALGILLTLKIPGNRGVVIRDSYPKLHDSTQRTFMDALDRAGIRYKGRENRDGWYHRLIFSNKSEVLFREARNLGRFLGSEFGWFLIDEALEVQKEVFKKLQGRLRLAAARGFHRGVLLSNPPHQNHWLHEVFGDEPRSFATEVDMGDVWELSTYKYMRISTRLNPHNPPGYLADLLSGLTQAEIARLVEGDYGYVPDGPSVYTTFEHHRHVGMPRLEPETPLVRAWDFGFRHPAVTFHQFWRCAKLQVHWWVLDAMDGRMIDVAPLADRVIQYTRTAFKGIDPLMIEDVGDIAGKARHSEDPAPIGVLMQPPYNLNLRYGKFEVDPGVKMIREFLRLPVCECGRERFQVHHRARYVIEGFQGGYHMPREKAGSEAKALPVKDGFYDDFMDTLRYVAELQLRAELIDPKLIDTLEKTDPRRMYRGRGGRQDPWRESLNRMIAEAHAKEAGRM